MSVPDLWFTRATLRRDAPDVAPLIDILLDDRDPGRGLDTTHRLLWTLMPAEMQATGKPPAVGGTDKAAFLWRRAPDPRGSDAFYMLGPRPREHSPFFLVETKPWRPVFGAGDRLAYDLVVNATVDRQLDPAQGRKGRKRIDVVADALRAAGQAASSKRPRGVEKEGLAREALVAWLEGLGKRNGFRLAALPDLMHQHIVTIGGRRKGGVTLGTARLTGLIDVTEPAVFIHRVATGFGRGKAFGCGLMLLRRAD